jgi:hypothetical protein
MAEPAPRREVDEEKAAILFFGFLFAALLGTALWIAYSRFHLTVRQLVEVGVIPLLACFFIWDVLRYYATAETKRETLWPRAKPYIAPVLDRKQVGEGLKSSKTLLGHESTGTPFFWDNSNRTMQSICFGMSGAGKTVLLESVAQQDIARGAPIIFIDGKGDLSLLRSLLPAIDKAGRTHQVRIIDPVHPEISCFYNPFWAPHGNPDEHVAFIFESFRMESHDFFDEHQRVYLENIARVLYHSGKRFNFYDVLVAAYDENIMKRQMKIALERVANTPGVSQQSKLTLNMSIHNLLNTFEDRDRVAKIQGLVNHMMTFMSDELALITGPYDRLLTLDEVVDSNLILFMSLNVNINARAVTALGRILLQNLQLMIGRRYAHATPDTVHPFVSVIMDEFSPFAYENFATIINTARGANVAFLLSLQNAPQLLQVGKGFRNDLSASPNTTFMLRIKDEETAQMFLDNSARVKQLRRTVRVNKTGVLGTGYREEDSESRSEYLDTTAQDEHLKKMPTGQMELLMSDHAQGMIHKHIHIRRGFQHFATDIPPALYPPLASRRKVSEGLHLSFPDNELEQEREQQTRKKGSTRGGR